MRQLTENALTVLSERYFLRDESGSCVEGPEELFQRVASAVSQVETRERSRWAARYYELLEDLRFLPNSPTLMNAGKAGGQLSACFVLPVEDSLPAVFDSLKAAALIHQSGGGTGFSYSRLRPRGSSVRSTRGVASGPVSFIRVFDAATEAIKQGGARRGANMAVLRVDHPDIEEFIESKRDMKSITNFNISVGLTSQFMRLCRTGGSLPLRDPQTGAMLRSVSARGIFRKIAATAWECGDPGIVFLDRINAFNPTPRVGAMESTNPCGEQPLLPFESCNLGSLNVARYWGGDRFDWDRLREDVYLSVRFLDNVVELNCYPLEETRQITLKNRKIGLGVMGFADLLLLMGVSYEAPEAVVWGERLMAFVDREAKRASAMLALERGEFANWKGSLWARLGYAPLRNATVSTVAPTGTISVIAGASSGIEPIFSAVFARNVLSGQRLVEVHPAVRTALEQQGRLRKSMSEVELESELGPAWSPAHRVSVEQHIRIQAAFQRHSDSAVSKTVNLPASASVEDVEKAYLLAYSLGCKGVTVYRDRSRPTQVLEKISCIDC